MQNLDSNIEPSQHPKHNANQQLDQQERADIISALTQHNNAHASNTSEPQHLDGAPPQNVALRLPNGVKLAIQQIARQFRPFNPPPAPHPISDAQIEAKEAEDAAVAAEARDQQAHRLKGPLGTQDELQRPRHIVIKIHERVRERDANQFFTPHTTGIEDPTYPQLVYEIEQGDDSMHYGPDTGIMNPEPPRRSGRIRQGYQGKTVGLRRRKLYALSVKRQRRLKMKKHKFRKLLRMTRTLRSKLDK